MATTYIPINFKPINQYGINLVIITIDNPTITEIINSKNKLKSYLLICLPSKTVCNVEAVNS